MAQSKSSGNQNRQSVQTVESDMKRSSSKASSKKSSKNEQSRIKAGSDEGAGGGAKQKQHRG